MYRLLVVCVLALYGCESGAERAERLRQDSLDHAKAARQARFIMDSIADEVKKRGPVPSFLATIKERTDVFDATLTEESGNSVLTIFFTDRTSTPMPIIYCRMADERGELVQRVILRGPGGELLDNCRCGRD